MPTFEGMAAPSAIVIRAETERAMWGERRVRWQLLSSNRQVGSGSKAAVIPRGAREPLVVVQRTLPVAPRLEHDAIIRVSMPPWVKLAADRPARVERSIRRHAVTSGRLTTSVSPREPARPPAARSCGFLSFGFGPF